MSEEMDIIKQAMKELIEQRGALLDACKAVRDSDHQIYPDDPSQYSIGVADGHRCAANMVRAAIKLAEKL